MAKAKKEELKLNPSKASFTLVGTAKLGDNAFPPESESKSKYISRRFNLGVEIQDKKVSYAEMFGGFFGNKATELKVFKKKKPDEEKAEMIIVDWEDRLNLDASLMKEIANFSFVTVALERDAKGKLFYKNFLSPYDAVQYIEEHLKDGDKVKVKGKLTPNYYNGTTSLKKEITYIGLADEEEVPKAEGILTLYIDDMSIGKSRVKQDDELDITATLIAYASKIDGTEVKKNIGYPINLVLPLHSGTKDKGEAGRVKKLLDCLKAKSGKVNELGVKVSFEEGVVVRQATIDDLDDEGRELIDMGIVTLEEALGKMSVSGGRMNRVVITAPNTVKKDVKGDERLRVEFEESVYDFADIKFDFESTKKEEKVEEVVEEVNEEEEENAMFEAEGEEFDIESLLSGL